MHVQSPYHAEITNGIMLCKKKITDAKLIYVQCCIDFEIYSDFVVVLGIKLAGFPFLPSTRTPLLQTSLWLFRLTANGYGTAIGLTR